MSQKIQIAAQVVGALKQALHRRIDPLKPASISFSSVRSEDDPYASSGAVSLKGSVQATGAAEEDNVIDLIRELIRGIADSYGADFRLQVSERWPVLFPHRAASATLRQAAERVYGRQRVLSVDYPVSEVTGLAEYARVAPAALLYLGRNSQCEAPDDEAIVAAVRTLVQAFSNFAALDIKK